MGILSVEVKKELTDLIDQKTLPHLQKIIMKLEDHLESHEEEKLWKHREDNSYQTWSEDEDRSLWAEFEIFLEEAAKQHKRGIGAIRSRLMKKIVHIYRGSGY